MRIIAGTLRGRAVRPPRDRRARPTSDRVREAWFAILGDRVRGARVLDLFAGSGALGLEALSRGAEQATFVELVPATLRSLRENLRALDLTEQASTYRGEALRFAAKLSSGAYDIAFADPPYDTDQAEQLVTVFRDTPFASILGVEHTSANALAGDDTRRYGNVALTFCYEP